ncbi:hypothetical protein Sango_1250600 [Sesamum angolense]|uniref:Uncharacterized protein n=1 Tax=Sesamum angolense TaxID=2727404 RepID=A0AAE1WQJ4_9LAMI|nr:hypothetical protein Sango_1250600 [Sesamum angolense]
MKHVQEQDAQIARLINKADNVDASYIMGKQVEAHDEVEASPKQHYTEKDKYSKEIQISYDGLIFVDQLKKFIEGTIRSKIEGSSKSSLTYSKPYTPRIDSMKMPIAGSIDGWEQLEQAFLNRFYSNRRTVSMVELTNSHQWKEEPIIGYINRIGHLRHDTELSMTASGVEGPPIQELRRTKEKQEVKKLGKTFSKVPSKESIVVNVAPFKLKSTAKDNVVVENNVPYERSQRKLTLKEMQAR